MRNRVKLQHLSLVLALAAMMGCGANKIAGTAATAGTQGNVKASLAWNSGAQSAARMLAAVPTGVANIKFTVTGSGTTGPIPVVTTTVPSSTGGEVDGIYPGTVAVAVKALDTNGNTLYEGYAINVAVSAGQTTNVGTINMAAPIVKAADAQCLSCHENALDATGQNIVANFKAAGSSHFTLTGPVTDAANPNGTVTGCAGCHGGQHNTPDPSAIGSTQVAGSAATGIASTRCFDCHLASKIVVQNDATTMGGYHDTYYLANANACSSCHQMHNSKAGDMERVSWAGSAHGSDGFANLTLAEGGPSGCALRCHNAKGFIAAMKNPTALVQGTMTPSPQMVTCDACHSNATLGVLRSLPGTKQTAFATYTTSTPGYAFAPNQILNPNKKQYYPDVAGSNVCIVCHSGTTEGTPTALGLSDPYFAGSSQALNYTRNGAASPRATVGVHNMPAAAVMYVKFGFTNLSTGTAGAPTAAYTASLNSDLEGGSITSTHRKFGTSAIVTDSHFSATNPAPANFLANGPCAVCHVSGSHSYRIDAAAIAAVCNHCHSSEGGHDLTTIGGFQQYFLDPNQEIYNNAILLGATILNNKIAAYNATPAGVAVPLTLQVGIDPVTSTQPMKVVFYDSFKTGGTYTTDTGELNVNGATLADFQAAAKALGYSTNGATDTTDLGFQKFLGACSNIAFFSKDQGGFAHARTYARRLIYDSLDYLDDGSLNMSVGATALNLSGIATIGGVANPVYGLYKKGPVAYDGGAPYRGGLLDPATSESMAYIANWDGTGAWTTIERP